MAYKEKPQEILDNNSYQNLKSILQNTSDTLGTEIASIFILDKKHQELWSLVSLDNALIKIDSRLGIAGEAIANENTAIANNTYEDNRFYNKVDSETNTKTKNIIVVPIKTIENKIFGTIQFLNKQEGSFTEDDKILVESVSNQIRAIIEGMNDINKYKSEFNIKYDELNRLRKIIKSNFSTKNIIGSSQEVQNNIRIIEQISDSDVNVLISGESGTGKELVAKAIHYSSKNSHKPFVALNCAALPDHLIESELFGIEKGIATGVSDRIGRFEEANGGTIFLDEIGDLPIQAQAKILRVLQEYRVQKVGGKKHVDLQIRVISATNKNLLEEIDKGNFREDLYYRLNVVNIKCPSLRDMPEDIPILLNFFIDKYSKETKKKFTNDSIESLCNYNWPGNIRELENFIKRIIAINPQKTIKIEYLPDYIKNPNSKNLEKKINYNKPLKHYIENLEEKIIRDYLSKYNNNQVKTAIALGISRQNLINKIKKYKLNSRE